jgi:hypothetical protein
VRANVLTVFNGVLVTLFVLVVATGRWQNGLVAGVVVVNAAIGIVQELRAKRTLDRLAVLNPPRARVVRGGAEVDVPVADVVLARPLLAWKVALIAAMAAIAVAVVAIRPLGEGIVLLHVTPWAVLTAGVLGVGGALLVELSSRVFSATPAAPRTRSAPAR